MPCVGLLQTLTSSWTGLAQDLETWSPGLTPFIVYMASKFDKGLLLLSKAFGKIYAFRWQPPWDLKLKVFQRFFPALFLSLWLLMPILYRYVGLKLFRRLLLIHSQSLFLCWICRFWSIIPENSISLVEIYSISTVSFLLMAVNTGLCGLCLTWHHWWNATSFHGQIIAWLGLEYLITDASHVTLERSIFCIRWVTLTQLSYLQYLRSFWSQQADKNSLAQKFSFLRVFLPL